MAKVEQGKTVIDAIMAAVALGGGLLGWAGFVVTSKSKRKEEERQRSLDTQTAEQKLRGERDDYFKRLVDCEDSSTKAENDLRDRIRKLEKEIDDVTAQMRAKSAEKHDLEAWNRALHTYCNDAKDELDHHGIAFRPLPMRHQTDQ